MNWIDKVFKLNEHNTTVRTEVIAGLTTFLTMAYIIFVNPSILGDAGMPKGAVFVATCLIAALGTLIMGLYANYPIAMAPGMGLNAYFAYVVVLGMGYVADRAGRGLHLGLPVPDRHGHGAARAVHPGHTAVAANGDHGGHRHVPRVDRAQERGRGRGLAGDLRDAGRPALGTGGAGHAGLLIIVVLDKLKVRGAI